MGSPPGYRGQALWGGTLDRFVRFSSQHQSPPPLLDRPACIRAGCASTSVAVPVDVSLSISSPHPAVPREVVRMHVGTDAHHLWWPDAVWIGETVALSLCPLLLLPTPVLVQQTTRDIRELQLVAWILYANVSATPASLRKSPGSSPHQLKTLLSALTSPPGAHGARGARIIAWMSRALPLPS